MDVCFSGCIEDAAVLQGDCHTEGHHCIVSSQTETKPIYSIAFVSSWWCDYNRETGDSLWHRVHKHSDILLNYLNQVS